MRTRLLEGVISVARADTRFRWKPNVNLTYTAANSSRAPRNLGQNSRPKRDDVHSRSTCDQSRDTFRLSAIPPLRPCITLGHGPTYARYRFRRRFAHLLSHLSAPR